MMRRVVAPEAVARSMMTRPTPRACFEISVVSASGGGSSRAIVVGIERDHLDGRVAAGNRRTEGARSGRDADRRRRRRTAADRRRPYRQAERALRVQRARGPAVATRLVLPTPPASEKTAITGARAAAGAGAACAGTLPSKIPRRQTSARRGDRAIPARCLRGRGGMPAGRGSDRSGFNQAGRPAVHRDRGRGQGARG